MARPPEILPIFPLTGVLLLPGMWLPLHIFEPRYRSMVADAQAGESHIGMIQPVVPREDNQPTTGAPPENPDLYPVGCAGHIAQCDRLEDGRYYLQLRGVTRFRAMDELPLLRGYRRVHADYAPYLSDAATPPAMDTARLIDTLLTYGKANNLPFDEARLRDLPGGALINGLSMSLPFGPAEKQALLEAKGLEERQSLLFTLLGMGLDAKVDQRQTSPPTLN